MPGIRASVHPQLSRAWLRLTAIMLLALAALMATLSLTGAQTMQDGGSQGEQTVEGMIVARVNPPAERSDGAYRMEFGFVTQAMRDAAGGVAAAIAADTDLLPRVRFMTEANWLRRAQADNRAWVASSLIRISIAASGGGQTELQGRVIARWNPKPDGTFRVEFGFLPEWAIGAVSSPGDSFGQKVQKAAAQHAVLPSQRALSESHIAANLHRSSPRWLWSSLIEVPLAPLTTTPPEPQPGPGVSAACVPLTIAAGSSTTCEATASGGATPYSYSWSVADAARLSGAAEPAGAQRRFSQTFQNPGDYQVQVTVTDSAGQRATDVVSVRVTPPGLTVRVTCPTGEVDAREQVDCQAAASGGTPPYSYSWSAPGAIPPVGAGPSWSGQFASQDTHLVQVTVTDSARQTGTGEAFVRVTMPPPPTVRIISCSPNEGGRAPGVTCRAAASGGTPPYSYSWSAQGAVPPVGSGPSWSPSFSSAGTHRVQVTVTDNARQQANDSTSVTITPPLTVEASSCTPEEINAGDTVTCWAQASGGTPPYTYSWSARGAVPPSGSDLVWRPQFPNAGKYTVQVTVTDSARQRADDSTSVTVGRELTVQVDCSSERVNVGDTVTCWATPDGGTSPYTYSWNARGASSPSGSGLVWSGQFPNGGSYMVQATVTDSAGQRADNSASVTLVESSLTVQFDCSPRTIDQGNSTSCRATAEGGAGGYTYRWSAPGGSPSSDSGQSFRPRFDREGNYTVRVTVTDSRGASADDDERIEVRPEPVDPPEVTASCSPTTIDEGDSTNCTATARRGAGGYTYQWRSGSANPSSESGQSYSPRFDREGSYTVRVTVIDRDGADAEDSVRIRVSGTTPPLEVTASCSPRTVDADEQATCRAEATGGTPPYTYLWTAGGRPVGQGESFRATYQATTELRVTVVDSRREQASDAVRVTVTPPDGPPEVRITCPSQVVEGHSMECRARASGGTPGYTYSWSASGASPSSGSRERFSPTFPSDGRDGSYMGRVTVTVTDSRGRSDSDTATVEVLEGTYIYDFARCVAGTDPVYHFDESTLRKHHIDMPWQTAASVFPGWGEHRIGVVSAAGCERWSDGTAIRSLSDACRLGAPGANCR